MRGVWGVALVFLLTVWAVPVSAGFVLLPPNGVASTGTTHGIRLSPDGVRVNVKNKPLRETLQRFQSLTGIRFALHRDVLNDRITANFLAPDWKTAVTRLLENFSVVGFGDDGLPSRVWVMRSRGDALIPAQPVQTVRRESPRPRTQVQKGPYPRVIRNPATVPDRPAEMTLSMLSPRLLMEPGLLNYLESAGVEVPEEMKRMYGMGDLPPDMPLSPHVWYDPMLTMFLQSRGIEPPGSPRGVLRK
ncbi:MAG: hypothetical protein ACE5GQ_07105 [Nitrospinales bacterium]